MELRDNTDKNIAFFLTASRSGQAARAVEGLHVPDFLFARKARARAQEPRRLSRMARRASHRRLRGPGAAHRASEGGARSHPFAHAARAFGEGEQADHRRVGHAGRARDRGDPRPARSKQPSASAIRSCSRSIPPDIAHKTEAGVVRIGLRERAGIARRVRRDHGERGEERARRGGEGVLVQEMVTGGVEMIVGIKYDASARADAASSAAAA